MLFQHLSCLFYNNLIYSNLMKINFNQLLYRISKFTLILHINFIKFIDYVNHCRARKKDYH